MIQVGVNVKFEKFIESVREDITIAGTHESARIHGE